MPTLLLLAAALTHPAKTPHPLPCPLHQLSLNTDQENGSFNGMSHSGVLLVLRNLSAQPRTLPAYPKITFSTDNHPLPTRPQPGQSKTTPNHSSHATKLTAPPTLAPGAELTATLRWVSAPVYPNSQCITPTQIALTIQTAILTAPSPPTSAAKSPTPSPTKSPHSPPTPPTPQQSPNPYNQIS